MKLFILTLFFSLNTFSAVETKTISYGVLEKQADNKCAVGRLTKIYSDAVELVQRENFHRWLLTPGSNLSFLDEELDQFTGAAKVRASQEIKEIKAHCLSLWTPDVIRKFKDLRDRQNQELNKSEEKKGFWQKLGG